MSGKGAGLLVWRIVAKADDFECWRDAVDAIDNPCDFFSESACADNDDFTHCLFP